MRRTAFSLPVPAGLPFPHAFPASPASAAHPPESPPVRKACPPDSPAGWRYRVCRESAGWDRSSEKPAYLRRNPPRSGMRFFRCPCTSQRAAYRLRCGNASEIRRCGKFSVRWKMPRDSLPWSEPTRASRFLHEPLKNPPIPLFILLSLYQIPPVIFKCCVTKILHFSELLSTIFPGAAEKRTAKKRRRNCSACACTLL